MMTKFVLVCVLCALALGIIGAAFLAVSQATNSWLIFDLDRQIGLYQSCKSNNCTDFGRQ